VLSEDVDNDGHHGLGTAITTFIEKDGTLTETFKMELKTVAKEELELLEKNMNNKRSATDDIFGVKRGYCQKCLENCEGYEVTK